MLECDWRGDISFTDMHLSFEKKIISPSCDLGHPFHSSTSSLKQLTLKLPVVYAILKVKDILKSFPLPLHYASLSLVLDRKISDASTVEEKVTSEINHTLLVNFPYREVQRTFGSCASETDKFQSLVYYVMMYLWYRLYNVE